MAAHYFCSRKFRWGRVLEPLPAAVRHERTFLTFTLFQQWVPDLVPGLYIASRFILAFFLAPYTAD